MTKAPESLSLIDWLMIGALAIGSTIALAYFDFAPRDPRAGVAVVFPPWVRSADASLRAASAGASLVRMGRYGFIVVVRPIAVDYAARILRGGAVAVVDPKIFGGCFSRRAGAT